MNWLDAYNTYQCWGLLRILAFYEEGQINESVLMDELDPALDIWNLDPGSWADPYLAEWASLLNTYAGSLFAHTVQLTEQERRAIKDAVRELKRGIMAAMFRQILRDVADYENGRISRREVTASLLSARYVEDGWDLTSSPLTPLLDALLWLDELCDLAAWDDDYSPSLEGQIATVKTLLQDRVAELGKNETAA